MNEVKELDDNQIHEVAYKSNNNETHHSTIRKPDNDQNEKPKATSVRHKIIQPYTSANKIQNTNIPLQNELRKPMIKPRKRRLKFEDRYKRITTFLENDLYDEVMELKETGEIDSIVQIVNDSIKLYLLKNYPQNRS